MVCLDHKYIQAISEIFFRCRKVRLISALFVNFDAPPARQGVSHSRKLDHYSPLGGLSLSLLWALAVSPDPIGRCRTRNRGGLACLARLNRRMGIYFLRSRRSWC